MRANGMIDLPAIVIAFLVGFAMKYGGLCTYAAAQQIIREKRFERLLAFLGAAGWATLLVVPLAWLQPEVLRLSATHDQWNMVLLGGVLLGAGAWLNRGCVFGTFVQLTGGNLNYVATLVGMVAGAVLARYGLSDMAPLRTESTLVAEPGTAAIFWLAVAALPALSRTVAWSSQAATRRLQWQPLPTVLVAVILGAGGGWLFGTVNGWDFASVLMRYAWHSLHLTTTSPTALAVGCTLAMVAGGVTAAVRQSRFNWQAPAMGTAMACLGGGMLMGLAAVILPGGNDGLLLSGIPGMAPHALLGFVVMLASILLLLALLPNDKGFSIGGRMSAHGR